jgi:hypothetical protein
MGASHDSAPRVAAARAWPAWRPARRCRNRWSSGKTPGCGAACMALWTPHRSMNPCGQSAWNGQRIFGGRGRAFGQARCDLPQLTFFSPLGSCRECPQRGATPSSQTKAMIVEAYSARGDARHRGASTDVTYAVAWRRPRGSCRVFLTRRLGQTKQHMRSARAPAPKRRPIASLRRWERVGRTFYA